MLSDRTEKTIRLTRAFLMEIFTLLFCLAFGMLFVGAILYVGIAGIAGR